MAEILFLAHRAPWPPDRGDRIRSWHMFDALTKLGRVHVAALCDTDADADIAREKLAPLSASLYLAVRSRGRLAALAIALLTKRPVSTAMFGDPGLGRHVAGLVAAGGISHIVGFSGQMGQYIPDRDHFAGRVVMDFVDVDSAKFAAYAAQSRLPPMHGVYRREARVLAAYEAALAQRAAISLFVSPAEAALFRQRSGLDADRVAAVENGIATDFFDPHGNFAPLPPAAGPLIVFTGQMDYRPNIEAADWFARQVLPLVRAARADARFAVVGRAPAPQVRALAKLPGVTVTGEVADVRPWLAAAAVVAAPLRVARGVQNKVLEAMAMARPVVATPAAAEGIDAAPGRDLLVAGGTDGSAGDFAAATLRLLADPAAGAALGGAARAQMLARYGWDARLAPLAAHLGLG